MTISRIRSSLLALAMQLSLVCVASAIEPGVQHYPLTHAPVPQQPSGPPHPGQTPPSGIDAGGPVFVEVEDPEIWKQPDLSTYGSGIPRHTGWWASYDYMRWTVSVPKKTIIGNPDVQNFYRVSDTQTTLAQLATVNTGFMNNGPYNGYRWEGGYQDKNRGVFLSAYRLYTYDQKLVAQPNAYVPFSGLAAPNGVTPLQGFIDPNNLGFDADLNNNGVFGRFGTAPVRGVFVTSPADFGDLTDLPIRFTSLTVLTKTNVWGAEANYQWRLRQGQKVSNWDLFAGPRYMKFDEQLFVSGVGGILRDSFWDTRASNNLVGGQIGIRGEHQHGRLTVSTEGRFMAGANIQLLSQVGNIASAAVPGGLPTRDGRPLTLSPTGFNTQLRTTTWAPLGELRFNLAYQIFNKASINVGWSGLVADGIARPSSVINYQLPNMGLLNKGENRQAIFLQGINIGVVFNR